MITAAVIRLVAFGSIMRSPFLKLLGVGMATAIFLNATVVRLVLVPALMQIFGRAHLVHPELARPQAPAP